MDNDTEWDFETILKRASLWAGIALALISIYFSYDGLDQTIQGGNPAYTDVAKFIGWTMAIVITLIQFIFNSDFTKLSSTLRVIGLFSYIYSMYTNYLGINHLFGFHGVTGYIISVFMDVTPEALIAWSLDEYTKGDMVGNIGKFFMGVGRKRKNPQNQNRPNPPRGEQRPNREPSFESRSDRPVPMPPFHPAPKKGQGRAFLESQRNNEHPNRFNVRDE